MEKICKKCNNLLNIEKFTKQDKSKDGYRTMCKNCVKQYNLQWQLDNPKYKKEYTNKNLERIKKVNKDYYEKNKPLIKVKKQIYFSENKEKINKTRRKYYDEILKNNDLFKASQAIRDSIRKRFKSKNYIKTQKTIEILGCSFEEFKQHLESLWEPWMNWDNYGNPKDGIVEPNKTWDLDHIISIKTGKTVDDLIKLNHYTNLQPLCSYINRFVKK
jgi:hypothetical protein